MTLRANLRAALLGAGASAALAAGASAETLRYAIGWPPGSTTVEAIDQFGQTAGELSEGDLEVKLYPLSLLNFKEAASGVRDGIADIVTILPPYFLAEFPQANFGTELTGLIDIKGLEGDLEARAGVIFGAAYTEYMMLHCEGCQQEMADQNAVFLAAASSPNYILQCNRKVTTMDDLQGARIRAGGAWWSRWVEAMGGTAVSMSVNETFEGLSQGVLDCTANAATELTNFSFIDVATDLTLGVPGAGFPSATAVMNRDSWGALSDAQREILLRSAAVLSAEVSWVYYKQGQENLATAEAQGIAVHEADPALLEASYAYIEEDLGELVDSYNERFGIGVSEEQVTLMNGLIEKWLPLIEQAESSEEVAELMWTEVMSKVDVSSYGQ